MGATVTKREASLESKYPCRDCERVITARRFRKEYKSITPTDTETHY